MISNPWYAVPDSHDVPDGRPVSIMRMGDRRALLDAMGIPEKP